MKPSRAKKLTAEFNPTMNGKVEYRGKNTSWSSVLLLKAKELSHHLVGKRKTVEFVKPVYEIERHDSDEIRKKILDISYTNWKKQGFSKGTLHQLKQKVKANESFTLNKHVRERLENWNNEVAGVEG